MTEPARPRPPRWLRCCQCSSALWPPRRPLDAVQANSTWGISTIGMLLVAVACPCWGPLRTTAAQEALSRRVRHAGHPGGGADGFIGTGDWVLAAVLYIIGEIGFSGSIFYDSLLPHIAKADEIDMVSARGYAMGYLGGGILLAINVLMIQMPDFRHHGPGRASASAAQGWRPGSACSASACGGPSSRFRSSATCRNRRARLLADRPANPVRGASPAWRPRSLAAPLSPVARLHHRLLDLQRRHRHDHQDGDHLQRKSASGRRT